MADVKLNIDMTDAIGKILGQTVGSQTLALAAIADVLITEAGIDRSKVIAALSTRAANMEESARFPLELVVKYLTVDESEAGS